MTTYGHVAAVGQFRAKLGRPFRQEFAVRFASGVLNSCGNFPEGLLFRQSAPRLHLGGQDVAVGKRPRVVVSSDIGGAVGLISPPFGPGRATHILEVIAHYEQDFPALCTRSHLYPKPDELRMIIRQVAFDSPGPAGLGSATERSRWLIQWARKRDPRPLDVLVWGGIEDLAQAFHDAPEILPKLRAYFVGGPNKMWSVDALHYIEQNHPKLSIIEANPPTGAGSSADSRTAPGAIRPSLPSTSPITGTLAATLRRTFEVSSKWAIYTIRGPASQRLARGSGTTRVGWQVLTPLGWPRYSLPSPPHRSRHCRTLWHHRDLNPGAPGFNSTNKVRAPLDNRIPSGVAFDCQALRFRFLPRDAKSVELQTGE